MPEPYEYPDALSHGPMRGRGANLQPGNRFEAVRLHVLGEYLDEARQPVCTCEASPCTCVETQQIKTQVLPDRSRTIINRVTDSPDIGFDWSINPYRGCEHGCIYCYARPYHEYLGLSSGLDFETKILAKFDAPKLLRMELAHPKWRGETIIMSGVTDPYQPIERKLRLTRAIVEILAECRQPVGFITKNRLILRDLDLLRELAKYQAVRVGVSITTLDAALAAKMEPRASSPADRLQTLAALHDAGIPTTVMVAPVLPGLTDREMPAILRAAAEAGAQSAGYVLLRLPYQIKALYLEWLSRHFPQRAAQAEHLLRDARGGKLYDADFTTRHRGTGPMAQQIGRMFRLFGKRYGLDGSHPPLSHVAFRRPHDGSASLFEL